jgi:hypothetical protein
MTSEPITSTWTWADMISSWRYWGLLIVYVVMVGLAGPTYALTSFYLQSSLGLSATEYGGILSLSQLGTALGFCLAWPAIKGRTRIWLIAFVAIKVAGLTLLLHSSVPVAARAIGGALVGLSIGSTLLTVPAVLGQARSGAESFVVTFGAISTIGIIVSTISSVLAIRLIDTSNPQQISLFISLCAMVSVIALLSLDGKLFTTQPPQRGYALTPVERRPFEVALLFLVPFYGLYWIYRIHGEVASTRPSRTLLSPRGALFTAMFVPFLMLVITASLIEILNEDRTNLGKPQFQSPVKIFVWTLLFPPAAAAMIQSAFNQVMIERCQ